jgi:exopolysaccharide biosynthesis protein
MFFVYVFVFNLFCSIVFVLYFCVKINTLSPQTIKIMGDAINIILDNLQAFLQRLISLPVTFLMAMLLVALGIVWLIILFFKKKYGWFTHSSRFILMLGAVALLLATSIITDKKISQIATTIEATDYKIFNLINDIGIVNFNVKSLQTQAGIRTDSAYTSKLYDINALKKNSTIEYTIAQQNLSPAADLIVLRSFQPLAAIFIAVIDLTKSQVVLTPEIDEKWFTSDFAKKYNCQLAINGEAGRTPMQGSGLGEWTGKYIVNGKTILPNDNENRPFIAFGTNQIARYATEKTVDTTRNAQNYNVIWGRFDILLEGKTQNADDSKTYPRTIMGIDTSGTKLYLLVADGRQPQYSLGITYTQAADILRWLGAHHAMACDQGGSSCMYVQKLGGIITRPADGQERFTYTHFGVKW